MTVPPPTVRSLSLVVGSADTLSLNGLRALIEQSGNSVVASARSIWQAAGQARDLHADMVLFDVGIEARLGRMLAAELRRLELPSSLIVITEQPLRHLDAGIAGWLSREVTAETLGAAIAAAADGLVVVHPQLLSGHIQARDDVDALEPLADPLTSREQDVLALLAQGKSNRQIAQQLAISEHTVKFHMSEIMSKLSASSRTEAVTRAARNGLLAL